jgi:hypothetical protein
MNEKTWWIVGAVGAALVGVGTGAYFLLRGEDKPTRRRKVKGKGKSKKQPRATAPTPRRGRRPAAAAASA